MSKVFKSFPTLYTLTSNGRVQEWDIWVEVAPLSAGACAGNIVTRYGLQDGKKQQTTVLAEATNVGRANVRTSLEQAVFEAEAEWKRRHDKDHYTKIPSTKTAAKKLLPMLAHKFKDDKKRIKYPWLSQPKLNGARCLAEKVSEKEIVFHSRNGKQYRALSHLVKPLVRVMDVGEVLDGELFCKELTFQEIIGAIKKQQDSSLKIQLWVYDMATDGIPFKERYEQLSNIVAKLDDDDPIILVPTVELENESEVAELHQEHTADGYEGTMLRNPESMYEFNKRSHDLLKYKDFQDAEFKIVGAEEGIGKSKGQAILVCVTKNNQRFNVRCKGTDEYRKWQFDNIKRLLGKHLTVTFQNYSDTGIPIFPVGVAVRDYE